MKEYAFFCEGKLRAKVQIASQNAKLWLKATFKKSGITSTSY